jgi:uncharacterized membrane protein
VLRGEPLAAIVPAEKVGTLESAIDRDVHIGRHRTLTQDSEFGIAQVVEIAIRALSPAVNDTFTGVACVDWLADALLTLAERPPLEGSWYDTGSRLRVWMPPVRLERLAKLAFDQIRQASVTTPAALIRQLEAICRLAPRLPEACRQALSDQADAIQEAASALVALDRRDLEAAWQRYSPLSKRCQALEALRELHASPRRIVDLLIAGQARALASPPRLGRFTPKPQLGWPAPQRKSVE